MSDRTVSIVAIVAISAVVLFFVWQSFSRRLEDRRDAARWLGSSTADILARCQEVVAHSFAHLPRAARLLDLETTTDTELFALLEQLARESAAEHPGMGVYVFMDSGLASPYAALERRTARN